MKPWVYLESPGIESVECQMEQPDGRLRVALLCFADVVLFDG